MEDGDNGPLGLIAPGLVGLEFSQLRENVSTPSKILVYIDV